jgi:hypothetical protein
MMLKGERLVIICIMVVGIASALSRLIFHVGKASQ